MNRITRLILNRGGAAAVAVALIAAPAHAQFFNNATGLAAPAKTITFSGKGLSDGTLVTTQFASDGVSFTSGAYFNGANLGGVPLTVAPVSGDYIANFNLVSGTGDPTNPFLMTFTTPQTSFAFSFGTNDGTTVFQALFKGAVVATSASFSTLLTNTNTFYGYTGSMFDQIRTTVTSPTFPFTVLDNVQLGTAAIVTTPEPGTFALLGAFLLPVAAVVRRRRSQR